MFRAIATACFCGRPAPISVRIFCETTARLEPDFKGMKELIGEYTHKPRQAQQGSYEATSPVSLRSVISSTEAQDRLNV